MPSPVQSNCDAHDTIANGQYGAVWSMRHTQQVCVRIVLLPSNVWQQFFGRSAFLRQQETDLPPAKLWWPPKKSMVFRPGECGGQATIPQGSTNLLGYVARSGLVGVVGLSLALFIQGCRFDPSPVAAVAEWYRYQTVACLVTNSSPVPLKTRRVGQRCTLNLSRAEMSSRWCGS
ncbi:histone-lysine N-methyltransferase SETMAR [Trichonephila clavipes]|nr:histone-lysine N-methyltransferase SETMAR [Trichonephila clavipes]